MRVIGLASAVFLMFVFACAQQQKSDIPERPSEERPTVSICAQTPSGAAKKMAGIKGAKAIFYSGEGPTVLAGHSGDPTIEPTPTPFARVTPTYPPESPYPTKPPVVPPDTNGRTEEYVGLSYWINLVDSNGNIERVTPSRIFTSGERIKLNIQTNKDGYLYVMNVGSTGSSHVLFPNPGVSSNLIKAWTPYEVPYGAYMRFDENPGEELLLVMLSPEPMDYLPFAPSIERPLNNQETQSVVQVAQAKGAKDIVLENDISVQPGTYVVAPRSSLETKMVMHKIKLCHQ